MSKFKAIQGEAPTLDNLASVNHLVGPNSCGKSSVLEVLQLFPLSEDIIKKGFQGNKDSILHYNDFVGKFIYIRVRGGDQFEKSKNAKAVCLKLDEYGHYLLSNFKNILLDKVTKITNSRADDTHFNLAF